MVGVVIQQLVLGVQLQDVKKENHVHIPQRIKGAYVTRS